MKTLENNVLIYDCDCPMCKLYSGAFIKTGMLDSKGRMPYHQMTDSIKKIVHPDRSRNEIALVDTAQNKVIYGLDSLLLILGYNFPILKTIFKFQPLYWFMKKTYAFISYNRKVIAPSSELNPVGACTPDYHVKYRWTFVLLASFFVAWILNLYFSPISFVNQSKHGYLTEWFVALGQLLTQGLLVYTIKKDRVLHYLGHNMVVSLIGSLLLVPILCFSTILIQLSEWLYIGCFMIPVSIMLWQHIRRVKILELPFILTITWILYRILIALGFIILNSKF